ncbi:MAG: DUF669 domain-containing protein [Elusimicrobiota bacterium]
MPRIDFSKVDDVQDFSPIPEGKYLCKLADIEEASTNAGDEMWKLRFQVAEGPHAGRMVFDNLVFSSAAMKRVKLVCSRMGLDVSGELDLTPERLRGRTCLLTVQTEEYEDSEGRRKKRSVIPFAGYERASGDGPPAAAAPSTDEEEPAF